MTVVIGVLTVAVVPVGVVSVTAVIGALTVTVAATCAGDVGIGSLGRETAGTRSVEGNSDGVVSTVDERANAGVASPLEPCFDAEAGLIPEPPAVLK